MAPDDVIALQRARDAGVAQSDAVAATYYPDDTGRAGSRPPLFAR